MCNDVADRIITIVYKAYPNRSVKRELRRRCDVACRVYNELRDIAAPVMIEGGHVPDKYEMDAMITQMRADDALIRSVKVVTLRDAADRLDRSIKRCMKKSAGDGKLHLPRRKTPSRYRSIPVSVGSFEMGDNRITLDGEIEIRYKNKHRPKGGEPVAVRVVLKGEDVYFHVTYRIGLEHHIFRGEMNLDTEEYEGYDFGLVDIITDTHGVKRRAPDFYAQKEKEIARLQRQIAELDEDSPKRKKKERQLQRIHDAIRRKRNGYLEHLADEMLNRHTVVAIEDLGIRKMIEKADGNVPRRKRFTEASLGSLTQKLCRKAKKSDVIVLKVNPANTTRTCSRCGHVGDLLPLKVRMFRCCECGLTMDRDMNAARNILGFGMETLRSGAEPSG